MRFKKIPVKLSQFKKNIISSFFAYGLNAIIVLITYPIIVNFLGYELLGLWATFTVIITLGEVGNIGLSETMMKFIGPINNKDDIILIKSYISSGVILLLLSGTTLISTLFIWREEIVAFLNIEYKYKELADKLIIVVSVLSFMQIVLSFLKGILAGLGRLDISNLILVCSNLFRVVMIIVLLNYSNSIWSLAMAYLIASIITTLSYYVFIRVRIKTGLINLKLVSRIKLKEILIYGSNIAGSNFISFVFIPFIKTIIAKYIGLSEVGFFEIAWKMIYNIRNLIQKGYVAFLPKVSELFNKLQFRQINTIINKSFKLTLVYSILAAVFLFAFAPQIVEIWLGDNFSIQIVNGIRIMVFGLTFSLLFVPHYYALLGYGKSSSILIEGLTRSLLNMGIVGFGIFFKSINLEFIYYSVSISLIVSHVYIYFSYLTVTNKFIKSVVS